jgi:hypothetical protein
MFQTCISLSSCLSVSLSSFDTENRQRNNKLSRAKTELSAASGRELCPNLQRPILRAKLERRRPTDRGHAGR